MKFFDASGGAQVQTNERLDRYAEAVVANLGLTKDETEPMHIEVARAVMAVADAELHAAAVPEGWHVVNPRYMADLKAAEAKLAQAWLEGHAAGRDYQGDGWNSDAHDPNEDNPYRADK